MADITMVIPTYWGDNSTTESAVNPADTNEIVFDHPTALTEEGTLSRLLESIAILNDYKNIKIAIISVSNKKSITEAVQKKVDNIIKPYKNHYDIVNISEKTLKKWRQKLAQQGAEQQAIDLVNLNNYASVRNICSLAGIVNNSEYTLFIDDDEVFTDPDFLDKMLQSMAASEIITAKGQTQNLVGGISALAGYYLQPDTYMLNENIIPAWRRPYWNNAAAMNRAFKQVISSPGRLKATPFVFGGNMTVRLDVLKQVPFDPYITRGEDIDFLINLHINDITFYLDNTLAIKHLPPPSNQPAWKKVREDAVRFLYERKKLRDHNLDPNDFMPYPGQFLGDDLEERIIKTNELLRKEYITHNDPAGTKGAQECEKNISLVKKSPFADFDTKKWLNQLIRQWQSITEILTHYY